MELSDMKPTRIAIPAGNTTSPRRQRGVVLFIALIVMVAMSLAAIALIRSVDTTNAIVGNLAFRMASILPANASIEQAASALFVDADIDRLAHITDDEKKADKPSENYYARRLPGEDARGVPLLLQKSSTASLLTKQFDAKETATASLNTHVTYLIERMCLAAGTATEVNCDLVRPVANPGDTLGDTNFGAGRLPYYRVTVRVDGPKNTASFVQAMLK
jgi:Tfp pilus assembly protein PilX